MTREIELIVEESYQIDDGRRVARLDPDTCLHLQVVPGELVKLKGENDEIVMKALRSERSDWGEEVVRVDKQLLEETEFEVGAVVDVEKVNKPENADVTNKSMVIRVRASRKIHMYIDGSEMIVNENKAREIRDKLDEVLEAN